MTQAWLQRCTQCSWTGIGLSLVAGLRRCHAAFPQLQGNALRCGGRGDCCCAGLSASVFALFCRRGGGNAAALRRRARCDSSSTLPRLAFPEHHRILALTRYRCVQHLNASVPPESLPFAVDDTAAPTGGAHRNELLQPELAHADSAATAQAHLRILDRTRLAYAVMDTTFDMALLATALCSVLRLHGTRSPPLPARRRNPPWDILALRPCYTQSVM